MLQTDRFRMVLETKISLATVTKWDKGEGKVSPRNAEVLEAAAKRLGVKRAADEVAE